MKSRRLFAVTSIILISSSCVYLACKFLESNAAARKNAELTTTAMFLLLGTDGEINTEEAVQLFETAAKSGDRYAQSLLALAYFDGLGVQRNYAKAITLARESAKSKDLLGQYLDEYFKYTQLSETTKDDPARRIAKMLKHLEKEADKNNAIFQRIVGLIYFKGIGIERNQEKAIEWTTRSAKLGYAPAQYNLGLSMTSMEDAFGWFEKAAIAGYPDSCLIVAQEYLKREATADAISMFLRCHKFFGPDDADSIARIRTISQRVATEASKFRRPSEYDLAIELYSIAIRIDPENTFALAKRDELYEKTGRRASAKKSVSSRKHETGDNHDDTVNDETSLLKGTTWNECTARGVHAHKLGNYPLAHAYHNKALNIAIIQHGHRSEEAATSLGNVGEILRWMGEYDKSEVRIQSALKLNLDILGSDHLNVAYDQWNLGELYHLMGKFRHSLTAHLESFRIRTRQLPADHPYVLQSHVSLGQAYTMNHQLDRAKFHLEAAYKYQPNSGEILTALGQLNMQLQMFQAAIDNYRNGLEFDTKIYGPNHENTVTDRSNLAEALRRGAVTSDNTTEHDRLLKEAVELCSENLRIVDSDSWQHKRKKAFAYYTAAKVFNSAGITPGTRDFFEDSRQIVKNVIGDQHPIYANLLKILISKLREDPDKNIRAKEYCIQSLKISKNTFGNESLAYISDLIWLGAVQRDVGNLEEAEKTLIEATEIYEVVRKNIPISGFGPTHTLGFSPYNQLAITQLMQGKSEDAWNSIEKDQGRILSDMLIRTETANAALPTSTATSDKVIDSEDSAIIGWLDGEVRPGKFESWVYILRKNKPVYWEKLTPTNGIADIVAEKRMIDSWREQLRNIHHKTNLDSDISKEIWVRRIRPVKDVIHDVDNLIVVPTNLMLGLPIESLIDDDGRLLCEYLNISYVPSATVFDTLRVRQRGMTREDINKVLFVAAEFKEADSQIKLQSIYPESIILGNRNTLETDIDDLVRANRLKEFDMIHMSCHASINQLEPQKSFLIV